MLPTSEWKSDRKSLPAIIFWPIIGRRHPESWKYLFCFILDCSVQYLQDRKRACMVWPTSISFFLFLLAIISFWSLSTTKRKWMCLHSKLWLYLRTGKRNTQGTGKIVLTRVKRKEVRRPAAQVPFTNAIQLRWKKNSCLRFQKIRKFSH